MLGCAPPYRLGAESRAFMKQRVSPGFDRGFSVSRRQLHITVRFCSKPLQISPLDASNATRELHKITILWNCCNPAAGLPIMWFDPAMRKSSTPKYMTEEEIAAFFDACVDKRDRAIFRLMYHRGLRASEIGKLQLADWRAAVGRIYITRLKGSVSGEFRLTDVEQSSLRAWVRERGNAPGPLFPSRNRRAISRYTLDDLVKRYCAAAGIDRAKAHCHAFKHSCGTHLLTMESDITIVQDHLGHKNIQNTMIYAQITNKRRDDAAERHRGWGKKR